jgi:hypothetical protein
MPTPDTQRDLGVIAETDHPRWVANRPAAQADTLSARSCGDVRGIEMRAPSALLGTDVTADWACP